MEILGYFYIVIVGESFIVEFIFELVDWKRFFSLGMMGFILVVIILGFLSIIVDFVVVFCYFFCCGYYNGYGYGLCGRKYYCLYYCYVFYCCYYCRYGYYFYCGSCGYRVVKL